MRIASWNVNGVRARIDLIEGWLRKREPDLVGLQELKASDDLFPHDVFEKAGYHVVTHGQKSWNGVAILARTPIEAIQRGLPGQEDLGARLITADLGGLRFTTVYCPNGKTLEHEDYARKLRWFDALAEHLEETHSPERPTILGGDFNVVPKALDSWRGEKAAGDIFYTEAERARLQRLLDWGLSDTFRSLHPEEQAFSWWDYRGGSFHRGRGLRIDFLLASEPALARLKAAWIDRDFRKKQDGLTASDHAPVIVDIEDPA